MNELKLKFDEYDLEQAQQDDILVLSDVLFWEDCYFYGDSYCLTNYEMGHSIYNCNADLVYIFPWSYLDELKQGKEITLYGHEPSDVDREILRDDLLDGWGIS